MQMSATRCCSATSSIHTRTNTHPAHCGCCFTVSTHTLTYTHTKLQAFFNFMFYYSELLVLPFTLYFSFRAAHMLHCVVYFACDTFSLPAVGRWWQRSAPNALFCFNLHKFAECKLLAY